MPRRRDSIDKRIKLADLALALLAAIPVVLVNVFYQMRSKALSTDMTESRVLLTGVELYHGFQLSLSDWFSRVWLSPDVFISPAYAITFPFLLLSKGDILVVNKILVVLLQTVALIYAFLIFRCFLARRPAFCGLICFSGIYPLLFDFQTLNQQMFLILFALITIYHWLRSSGWTNRLHSVCAGVFAGLTMTIRPFEVGLFLLPLLVIGVLDARKAGLPARYSVLGILPSGACFAFWFLSSYSGAWNGASFPILKLVSTLLAILIMLFVWWRFRKRGHFALGGAAALAIFGLWLIPRYEWLAAWLHFATDAQWEGPFPKLIHQIWIGFFGWRFAALAFCSAYFIRLAKQDREWGYLLKLLLGTLAVFAVHLFLTALSGNRIYVYYRLEVVTIWLCVIALVLSSAWRRGLPVYGQALVLFVAGLQYMENTRVMFGESFLYRLAASTLSNPSFLYSRQLILADDQQASLAAALGGLPHELRKKVAIIDFATLFPIVDGPPDDPVLDHDLLRLEIRSRLMPWQLREHRISKEEAHKKIPALLKTVKSSGGSRLLVFGPVSCSLGATYFGMPKAWKGVNDAYHAGESEILGLKLVGSTCVQTRRGAEMRYVFLFGG